MSNSPTLLIDVGSANVGVALCEKRGDEIVLSHVERTELQNISGKNTPAIAALALDALKASLERLQGASPFPKSAHIFFAAPWYSASIRAIHFQSEKTLKITKGTVEKAVSDYRKNNEPAASPEVRQIESTVSQTSVNGYPTAVEGVLRGNSLKIDLYESAVDAPFVETISEMARAVFAGARVAAHSFPFAAFTVLRALRDEQSFVMVDVGGEITDVAVVTEDSMRFLGSFPVGALSILRSIAGAGSVADAASRMSLYTRGELNPEESARFTELFERVTLSWREQYQGLLDSALAEGPVPNTTFLMADAEELSWFKRIVENVQSAFPIHPIALTPDFFQSAVVLGEEGKYDAFLCLEALYAQNIFKGF